MNNFWIDIISIEQLYKERISEHESNTSLWKLLKVNSSKNTEEVFTYSLALSDTFYGFNNDLGNTPYEAQEQEANTKYSEYKTELSQLLKQQPNSSLLPRPLDSAKLDNEKEWNVYYAFMDKNPLAYKFEENITVWNNSEIILFLSMYKEDKELPYKIHLGAINLEFYQKVLNKYHQVKQALESGVFTDFSDEVTEEIKPNEPFDNTIYDATSIQHKIKEKAHDLTVKNKVIRNFTKQGNKLPTVFDDGKLLIFHLLDSINYIVNPLREEDIEYINLVLQNGANEQLNCIDSKTGMTSVLYAYARGLTSFAEFLEIKGANRQKELTNPQGHQLLLEQLINSTHYRREKLIQNILPFIPSKLVKAKEQILWKKLIGGAIYGQADTITQLLINIGLNPEKPLKNGTNILAGALLLNDEKWIQTLKAYLPIEKHINQTDNQGNSLLHLWANIPYNNSLPSKGISALRNIVSHTELFNNSLNQKKQTALHLLAMHEVDPYNSKEEKKAEIDALLQVFDLINSKVSKYNQQDTDGNTALHYLAGYHLLEETKGKFKPRYFNKTNEQQWRLPIIKKLIINNVDTSLKNNDGFTAQVVASLCNLNKISKILTGK